MSTHMRKVPRACLTIINTWTGSLVFVTLRIYIFTLSVGRRLISTIYRHYGGLSIYICTPPKPLKHLWTSKPLFYFLYISCIMYIVGVICHSLLVKKQPIFPVKMLTEKSLLVTKTAMATVWLTPIVGILLGKFQ